MKKNQPVLLLPLVLLVISITLFDFENPSFDQNAKAYIGAIASVIILVFLMVRPIKKINS